MNKPKTPLEQEAAAARKNIRMLEAERFLCLERFGDLLADKQQYRKHKGLDALHFYLVEKYHWKPSEVKALSWDDLWFLFEEAFAESGEAFQRQSAPE